MSGMSDPVHETSAARSRRAPVKEFFTHLVRMPRWQLKVMIVAAVLAVAGLVGQASHMIATAPTEPATAADRPSADSPAARSSFMSGQPANDEREPPPVPEPNLYQRIAPWATRLGIGFIGGFIIGWAFRAFLKTMAIVTVAAAGLFWALNHFNILDLDIASAESSFNASTGWLAERAEALKDRAMTLVPSSFSSLFGMFLGFRRR